jgi:DNA-binding NarL/FixJ family response regulator
MIKVIIADDHPLTREGVKRALDEKPDIRVVGEAGTGPELEAALTHVPDVLLLDIRMPDFDAVMQVPELRARFPGMKIVIMTAYESEFYAQALMGHVDGYLLKVERMDAFATAVQEVSKGRKYFTDRALNLAFNSPEVPKLSEREMEVLKLAARGLKTTGIAQELFISNRTVETHIQDACHKLGVRGRTAAVAKAMEIGLISAGAREDVA